MSKIKFAIEDLEYQNEAVNSVVTLFKPFVNNKAELVNRKDYEFYPNTAYPTEELNWEVIKDELTEIQEKNGVSFIVNSPVVNPLDDPKHGYTLEIEGTKQQRGYPEFTVEMETGTGKTYVYLRTIIKLNKEYGFTKFIIVVPSIAIFEGVKHSIENSIEYFARQEGIDIPKILFYGGNSNSVDALEYFAKEPNLNILIITAQSFNSTNKKLYKKTDKAREYLPFQFIQKVNPILIIDEPQKMEGIKTLEGLATLHPLFMLRYSATHKTEPNPVYRLTPLQAFQEKLVKRIQTIGLEEVNLDSSSEIELISVKALPKLSAKVRVNSLKDGNITPIEIDLKKGDDLFNFTTRPEHKKGYTVKNISAVKDDSYIEFEELTLRIENEVSKFKEEIFRYQIRHTIEMHFERQEMLKSKNIKVLSLFFVDKVANFVNEGIIKRLFIEEFESLKKDYPFFRKKNGEEVQASYFSEYKTKDNKIEYNDFDDKSALSDKEEIRIMCEKIMRKKEELLSFDDKTCFIFSHSAIREGWDNPNVFQICTLRQSHSEINRRQEIGRGLRICVDQAGNRVREEFDNINVLTIIANESYSKFASELQQEYRNAGYGEGEIPEKPTVVEKKPAKRNKKIFINNSFLQFWEKLNKEATYEIHLEPNAFTKEAIKKINDNIATHNFEQSKIVIQKSEIKIVEFSIMVKAFFGNREGILTIQIKDSAKGEVTKDINVTTNIRHCRLQLKQDSLGVNSVLKQYSVIKIDSEKEEIHLSDGSVLRKDIPHFLNPEFITDNVRLLAEHSIKSDLPLFNIVDRASDDTKLPKQVIYAIFDGLEIGIQKKFFDKPEAFYYYFIHSLKSALRDHVSANVKYIIDENVKPYELDKLFQDNETYPQRKVVQLEKNGIKYVYDHLCYDSDVELEFAKKLLNDEKVVVFFKFPAKFKIQVPKIFGYSYYNPDWGIIRMEKDKTEIELVRETKGTEDTTKLRFSQEKYKIDCGKAFFKELGIDYDVTARPFENWEKSQLEIVRHSSLMHD
ncbi:MAG: DEAD/DEAH box helicase family protein [Leptospiraceae bacterium]|nr:DEAD/DEAH box helicase family protein [Leptospiraceae bacterium]